MRYLSFFLLHLFHLTHSPTDCAAHYYRSAPQHRTYKHRQKDKKKKVHVRKLHSTFFSRFTTKKLKIHQLLHIFHVYTYSHEYFAYSTQLLSILLSLFFFYSFFTSSCDRITFMRKIYIFYLLFFFLSFLFCWCTKRWKPSK